MIPKALLVLTKVPQTPRPTYPYAGPHLRIYTGDTSVDHARGMHRGMMIKFVPRAGTDQIE